MLEDFFDKLAAPFPPDAVSWRVGSTNQDKTKGLALAYIDARDVMERLDAVCGPDGWQNRYSHVGAATVCEIGIRVAGDWLWKADGAGASDIEAEKGALSDAFKRAAVRWGVGRYLYALSSPWVDLVPAGRSQKIKDTEYGKLRSLLTHHAGAAPKAPAEAQHAADQSKPRTDDRGVKRLSSAEAKRIGLHTEIEGKLDRCDSLLAVDLFDSAFDVITAQCPLSWLDALRNRIILRREELTSTTGQEDADMDEAYRTTMAG